jgi:hypothetical protein
MNVRAIITKHVGPSLRIRAIAPEAQLSRVYNRKLSPDLNHMKAARALAAQLGWRGRFYQGGARPGEIGPRCFVWLCE